METGNMEKAMYDLIRNLAATTPQCKGLTFGYIGNFEPWGDERVLRVWADGKLFWDCRADSLDAGELSNLIQKLNSKYDLEITGYTPEAISETGSKKPMIEEVLRHTPSLPQRQDSVSDQLSDLIMVANHLGMYDAADTINTIVKNLPQPKWETEVDQDCDSGPGM